MGTIISWTDYTWNPVTGCSRISEGCRNCYAERLSLKFGHTKLPWTAANSKANVTVHPERFFKLKTFKSGSRVFVNSMSDLMHKEVPDDFIVKVFEAMNSRIDLVFQILTKRPERLPGLKVNWSDNIWMGTSVEDNRVASRLEPLRECGAAVKFISAEPLINSLDCAFEGIDWVIVGGESGPGYRPMDHAWARTVRDSCIDSGTAFFFKQSAAYTTERGVCLEHDDKTYWVWHQMPGNLSEPIQVPQQMNAKQLAEHFGSNRIQSIAWKT